jgi:hypothetical protein
MRTLREEISEPRVLAPVNGRAGPYIQKELVLSLHLFKPLKEIIGPDGVPWCVVHIPG